MDWVQKRTATRYSFRYRDKIVTAEESRKLLKGMVNRAGLEPATR